MNDCANADVRDLLPDLLHGRLSGSVRASVEAHVAGCADCLDEVALLRDVRGSLGVTPAVDLRAIRAAIPAYRTSARPAWAGWRAAAAIAVLVAGGASVAVISRGPSVAVAVGNSSAVASVGGNTAVASAPALPVGVANGESTTVATRPDAARPTVQRQGSPTAAASGGELALAEGSLTDLSDGELAALLRDLESLDGVPTTDVDAAVISPMAPLAPARGTP